MLKKKKTALWQIAHHGGKDYGWNAQQHQYHARPRQSCLLSWGIISFSHTISHSINSYHVKLWYKWNAQMTPPTFRCTREKENGLHLQYIPGKPSRTCLSPLVIGEASCFSLEVFVALDISFYCRNRESSCWSCVVFGGIDHKTEEVYWQK